MHSGHRYGSSDEFAARPLSAAPSVQIDLYAVLVRPILRWLHPSNLLTAMRERIVEPLQDKWNYWNGRWRARRRQRVLLLRRSSSSGDLEAAWHTVTSERTRLIAGDTTSDIGDKEQRTSPAYSTFTTRSVLKRHKPISIHRGVARSIRKKSVRFAGADVRVFRPQSYEQWDRRSLITKPAEIHQKTERQSWFFSSSLGHAANDGLISSPSSPFAPSSHYLGFENQWRDVPF
ncbi:hypothetical protein BOTBODRAFT_174484 [Botryobasidium botryosum FD-172 SS1]|uniref:Uncharacterized protein n=1 Tax=Botryobasidium botryosum (strain FD-172 SS1) TaxID=930990 RepID=A0A067MIQ0_BOTB1|nr:hypothetical protein BOTBODRAFT_174484 [Botryobasidium botryosum FD-172 SS1]